MKNFDVVPDFIDSNFWPFKHLNERMEELRITSDDLDQAMCIIENYKILKLEKFEQGKLSKLVFSVTYRHRSGKS